MRFEHLVSCTISSNPIESCFLCIFSSMDIVGCSIFVCIWISLIWSRYLREIGYCMDETANRLVILLIFLPVLHLQLTYSLWQYSIFCFSKRWFLLGIFYVVHSLYSLRRWIDRIFPLRWPVLKNTSNTIANSILSTISSNSGSTSHSFIWELFYYFVDCSTTASAIDFAICSISWSNKRLAIKWQLLNLT